MRQLIKEQNFGVEIELTGITRCDAAKVIAEHYHTSSRFIGSGYRAYAATDSKGRTWKAMSDGSIQPERKVNVNREEVIRSRNAISFLLRIFHYQLSMFNF